MPTTARELHWFERRWILDLVEHGHLPAHEIARKIGCYYSTVHNVVLRETGMTYRQFRERARRKYRDGLPRTG